MSIPVFGFKVLELLRNSETLKQDCLCSYRGSNHILPAQMSVTSALN
jgi:hypothetical protein